jgi:membrane-bound serine protease (ClpP class)
VAAVIVLLVVGVVLMVLETVLPGLIAGILGFMCLAAGVILSFAQFGPETGAVVLVGVLLALVAGCVIWIKYFPGSPMARLFISERITGEIGAERPDLLDQVGRTSSPLRPSGIAVINGQRVDVITEGSHVPKDTWVKVVSVEGLRVIVRPLPDGARTEQTNLSKP